MSIVSSSRKCTIEKILRTGVYSFYIYVYKFPLTYLHRAFRQELPPIDSLTYADAGVSIDAGNELVQRIKACVKSTRRSGADAVIGGFGGVFDLNGAGYDGPLIVGGIDGVGTKLKVAQIMNKHDTVGKQKRKVIIPFGCGTDDDLRY